MQAVVLEAVNPCIDCGDPNGASRKRKNGSRYILRVKGQCWACYKRGLAESNPQKYKVKRDTSRPKIHGKSRGLLNPPKISVRHFLSPSSAVGEAVTDQEKRVQSMRWVQEYRKFRKGWAAIKVKCAEQIKLQTEKLYEDADW